MLQGSRIIVTPTQGSCDYKIFIPLIKTDGLVVTNTPSADALSLLLTRSVTLISLLFSASWCTQKFNALWPSDLYMRRQHRPSLIQITACCIFGSFIFLYGHHWGCLNNPIFSNLGLCAACWTCFMCHHELWPTSVSYPFSSLTSLLGFTGGQCYQKITIPIFRRNLQILHFQVAFSYILFFRHLFSLLSSFFYCSMWLFFSQGII